MNSTCRRFIGTAAASAALLIGSDGPALAASLAPSGRPAAAPHEAFPTQSALMRRAVASGIVPGDRHTGYPSVACTPANDGEEVTTLLTVLSPVPIATFMNWVCDGATRTWKRR
jgi:hypothetical protein